jgi:hypothetical protein
MIIVTPGLAVMLSPPSALDRPARQVAWSEPSRYEVELGRNVVPKICAFPGSGTEAGRLSVAGAARGAYGVPA